MSRVVFTILALSLMWGGPAYRQVLGGRNKYLPRWVMFHGKGLGVVDADFFVGEPSARHQVDPFDVLEIDGPRRKHKKYWRMKSTSHARTVAREICMKLPEPDSVYLFTRQAVDDGWETQEQGEIDWCSDDARRRAIELDRKLRANGKLKQKRRPQKRSRRSQGKERKKRSRSDSRAGDTRKDQRRSHE